MSVLSKVFVVLVSLLAVLLVALVIPYVANQDNYREQYLEELTTRRAAQAAAQQHQAETALAASRSTEEIVELRNQVTSLTEQLRDKSDQLADAKAQVESESSKAEQFKIDLSRLTVAERQHAALLEQVTTELKGRREADVDRQTKMIQQADRINELTSQVEALEIVVRRGREQNRRAQEALDESRERWQRLPQEIRMAAEGQAPSGETTAVTPSQPVFGQVVEVEEIAGKLNVRINVGKADGVTENMRFLVHRGDTYLGDLMVTLVDEREAAGVVERPQGTIQTDDNVQAGGRI